MEQIADAVLLDARQDVGSARLKVTRSGLDRVAIRRTEGLVVFWYVFDAQEVLDRFKAHDDKTSVKIAMDLHERTAAPVRDRGTPTSASTNTKTVVLDGARFIGVCSTGSPAETEIRDLPDPAPKGAAVPRESEPLSTSEWTRQEFDSRGRPRRLHRTWFDREGNPLLYDPESRVPAAPQSAKVPARKLADADDSAQFTAHPKIEAPATVHPGQRFSITIGLASRAQPGTLGGPITVNLPTATVRFTLDVLVIAEGFGMPAGGRHRIEVERSNADACSIQVPLVAPKLLKETLLTTLSVIYFYGNVPCGTAARRLAVIPVDAQPMVDTHGTGTLWTANEEAGGAVSIQQGIPAVDLTVTISKPDGNDASGRFVWSFQSPHNVPLPAMPVPRDLGMDTRELGRHIIEGIQSSEALNMVELQIGGLARDITDRMPVEFWPLLRQVAKAVAVATPGRLPTMLFLTAEAHVPWELALVDPPLDPGAPPYLGCQTEMGRWPLSDSGNPALPPAGSMNIRELAVIIGDYAARSGWRKLAKAESEGRLIASKYGAISLPAEPSQIKQLLCAKLPSPRGPTGTEVVHFACHGEATQGHALDAAIILEAGQRMNPTLLANAPLGRQNQPFLFLNACQVGTANELLGSFSGFAGESLKGGFRGFLAPLWSVDDGLAHEIALEFYKRAFGSKAEAPEPVGSILRDLRRRFVPDTEKNSATRLAYVFYGHPGLILHLRKE